jgi:hypothetical protein
MRKPDIITPMELSIHKLSEPAKQLIVENLCDMFYFSSNSVFMTYFGVDMQCTC